MFFSVNLPNGNELFTKNIQNLKKNLKIFGKIIYTACQNNTTNIDNIFFQI